MAEKTPKTPTQQLKSYKRLGNVLFFSEFLSIFTPFIVIGIVNYDEYFVEYNGTKMSIACILAVALMGIATWLVAKEKFNNSFVTLIVGWATVTAIFFLLGQIINDIAYIMLFGLIGILGAYGLDLGSKACKSKAQKIKDAIEQAEKELTVEQYKQESATKTQSTGEKKKVKIKLIKSPKKEQEQDTSE